MNLPILAAAGFLPIAINILLVILVSVSLLLCLVVLMQRPKQEGLGAAFGGGMTDQAFGARTTDVLQKSTVWLGTVFFVLALTLQVLVASQNSGQTPDKEVKAKTEEQTDSKENKDEVAKVLEEVATKVEQQVKKDAEAAKKAAEEVTAPATDATDAAPVTPTTDQSPEQ